MYAAFPLDMKKTGNMKNVR